jgi:hypothetical protein
MPHKFLVGVIVSEPRVLCFFYSRRLNKTTEILTLIWTAGVKI